MSLLVERLAEIQKITDKYKLDAHQKLILHILAIVECHNISYDKLKEELIKNKNGKFPYR